MTTTTAHASTPSARYQSPNCSYRAALLQETYLPFAGTEGEIEDVVSRTDRYEIVRKKGDAGKIAQQTASK
jgi:hypothetical protein